jgi:hypothetical protein
MGILKKIFNKKEKSSPSYIENSQKQKEVSMQLNAVFKNKKNKVCKLCEKPILDTEKYAKQGGYFWHRTCWSKAKAMAKKDFL